MTIQTIKIKDLLPNSHQRWKLVWFGSVQRNPRNELETTIQVVFIALIDETTSPYLLDDKSPVTDSFHTNYCSIGLIRKLIIGSIWQGNPIAERIIVTHRQEKYYDAKYDSNTLTIFHSLEQDPNPPSKDFPIRIIPNKYYKIGPGHNSSCIGINFNDDPYGIIIPSTVMLQYYYAKSDYLARAATGGWLEECPEKLINLDATGFREEDDMPYIKFTKNIRDNKAVIKNLANFYFDDLARKRFNHIHQSIVKFYNPKTGTSRLTVQPPFNGHTQLKVRGKSFPIKNKNGEILKWRFIVYFISSCSLSLPIKEFIWGNERDNRKAFLANENSHKSAFANITRISGDNIQKKDFTLLTNEEPSNKKLPVYFTDIHSEQPGLYQVTATREDKEEQQASSDYSNIIIDTDDETGFASSGEPGNNESGPYAAVYDFNDDDESQNEYFAANTIEVFIETIDYVFKSLKTNDLNIALNIIQTSKKTIPTDFKLADKPVLISLFPSWIDGVPIEWSYVDYKMTIPRQVMTIELKYKDKYFYIFEAQRENEKEHIAIQVCGLKGFKKFTLNDINRIINNCVDNMGIWFRKGHRTIRFQRVNHTAGEKSEKRAKRIIKIIRNNADKEKGIIANGWPTQSEI